MNELYCLLVAFIIVSIIVIMIIRKSVIPFADSTALTIEDELVDAINVRKKARKELLRLKEQYKSLIHSTKDIENEVDAYKASSLEDFRVKLSKITTHYNTVVQNHKKQQEELMWNHSKKMIMSRMEEKLLTEIDKGLDSSNDATALQYYQDCIKHCVNTKVN